VSGVGRLLRLAIGPAILIAVWALIQASGAGGRLLPGPGATLSVTAANLLNGALLRDIGETLWRVLAAFAAAAAIGVPLGLLLGCDERIYRSVEFLVDFFRSTPATALFPLAMLLFGLGDTAKIAIAAFAAALVILFNVAYGVMNARKTRLLAARSMGASRLRAFVDVVIFETLPQTFVGLRTGISLALVVVIVAEMFIGSTDGLGHRIIDAQISYNLEDLYGSILAAGALGYALNAGFLVIETRFIHWAGK
jgi:NitT/TauT family transport system permease protein